MLSKLFSLWYKQRRYGENYIKISKRRRLIIECFIKSFRFDLWKLAIARKQRRCGVYHYLAGQSAIARTQCGGRAHPSLSKGPGEHAKGSPGGHSGGGAHLSTVGGAANTAEITANNAMYIMIYQIEENTNWNGFWAYLISAPLQKSLIWLIILDRNDYLRFFSLKVET